MLTRIDRMKLLIDGYNLLHATDLFGTGVLAGTLQGSREALLDFLAVRLTKRERRGTTIVFDAAGAPPGLPDEVTHCQIQVCYARNYPDADALLEELIEKWRSPRELLVVSSDHRVQRASRRRGASYQDSQPWYNDLCRRRPSESPQSERPIDAGSPDFWAAEFEDSELEDKAAQQDTELAQRKLLAQKARREASNKKSKKTNKPAEGKQPFGEGILDPFPPGYAEDLAKEIGNGE